jgi:hypothetical protein
MRRAVVAILFVLLARVAAQESSPVTVEHATVKFKEFEVVSSFRPRAHTV